MLNIKLILILTKILFHQESNSCKKEAIDLFFDNNSIELKKSYIYEWMYELNDPRLKTYISHMDIETASTEVSSSDGVSGLIPPAELKGELFRAPRVST